MFDPFPQGQDPFHQQPTWALSPMSSPPQYISPYEAMLGLPPGSGQIANVLGPMLAGQQQAQARQCAAQAQFGAQSGSGCAAALVFVLALALAATAGTVLAAGAL